MLSNNLIFVAALLVYVYIVYMNKTTTMTIRVKESTKKEFIRKYRAEKQKNIDLTKGDYLEKILNGEIICEK